MQSTRKFSFKVESPGLRKIRISKYRKATIKKLRTLIAMAKSSEKKLIAKGDETEFQLRRLSTVIDDVPVILNIGLRRIIDECSSILEDIK